MAVVENHPCLLDALIGDERNAPVQFRPTAYWQIYRDRVVRAIRDTGLTEVRRNQAILKGYATGGVPRPSVPSGRFRRAVFKAFEHVPPFVKVVAEYQRLLRAQHGRYLDMGVMLARDVLDKIAVEFPEIRIPENLGAGAAEDLFEWNNTVVSAAFVPYLARAADFYQVVDRDEVKSLLEIGPGLGLSTLAHFALNPNCKTFVNVDISTTVYVATQFLRAVNAFEIVDYLDIKDKADIPVGGTNSATRCLAVPPWVLPRLSGKIDWFHNAFSFKEMETDVVTNYATQVKRLVEKGAWIISSAETRQEDAKGRPLEVDFGEIEGSFAPEFTYEPGSVTKYAASFFVEPGWNRHYRRRC